MITFYFISNILASTYNKSLLTYLYIIIFLVLALIGDIIFCPIYLVMFIFRYLQGED